eukprot:CAMPEP_0119102498 /NCGR_PEP_ID=MMETSP1180-20130426/1223_1 /TAXON_ID=3052 ORGANISM="Chlamydomonas cf sp, Strain CCMP681" /NCGR_SAMPLE_ID=MMETSP1180 /ASSEMBLY_ACC=CAM_ASM_000741 /LENGTH=208 /DNA_ID=CAMNT_0007086795 /DNA_START=27 /DNA_END=653 /DNA_ORIENTATION=-
MAFTVRSPSLSRMASASARPSRGVVVVRACISKNSSPGMQAGRRAVLLGGLSLAALISLPMAANALTPQQIEGRQGEISHTEDEWKEILGSDAYKVMRKAGTELPFSSPLTNEKRDGVFVCAGCKEPLFLSATKYSAGTGWPSFYDALPGAVDLTIDSSIPFMAPRTEVRCRKCQGHLGHSFTDGPEPTGIRYCMNGRTLNFVPTNIS